MTFVKPAVITPPLFDSHAHVAAEQFNDDREAVIARARLAGVQGWLEVGTDIAHSQRAIALAEVEQGVGASVGVHPSDITGLDPVQWQQLEQLVLHPKVVAVGEVGLDYYRGGSKAEQLPVLERFVALALQNELPVIFHVRDGATASAHDDLIAWLQSLPGNRRPRGVIHTFSGNQAQAAAYVALGLYLSFSGVLTFKNAGDIAIVATTTPLERILIETDCPFLAPMPYRGERNEPAYVQLVAVKLAQLRQLSVAEVASAVVANTQRLFTRLGIIHK